MTSSRAIAMQHAYQNRNKGLAGTREVLISLFSLLFDNNCFSSFFALFLFKCNIHISLCLLFSKMTNFVPNVCH